MNYPIFLLAAHVGAILAIGLLARRVQLRPWPRRARAQLDRRARSHTSPPPAARSHTTPPTTERSHTTPPPAAR